MSFEVRGSAITLVSMKRHFGHSKMRFSQLSGFGDALSSPIRVWHLRQRGRSIAINERTVGTDIASHQKEKHLAENEKVNKAQEARPSGIRHLGQKNPT
ncbi:hypothetical protein ABID59_000239 [Bradyrhizobium sp. S3.3.6]|uniref:hypothetical protein n=1 Tax=Bradyrhizobium sp. S3.3.6 TaxID=3156429 RepID=UPI00339A24A4